MREYFFDPENLPENYNLFVEDEYEILFRKKPEERKNPYNYPVGVITYDNFYSNEELIEIEKMVVETE